MADYESMTREELIRAVRELDAKLTHLGPEGRPAAPDGGFALWQYERELFFERSPYPMLIHDRETLQFLRVNAASLALYGYSNEEFLAMKRFEIRTNNNLRKVLQVQRQPTGYMHYRGLRSHHKKSGEVFRVEIFSQDIIFKSFNARVTLIIDATEREQTLAELQRRQQEFSALAENAPDIIARFDRDFRHVYVNRAVTAVTGHPPEYFLGKTNGELGMPENLVVSWHDAIRRAFETAQQQEIEFEYPKQSRPLHFESRLVPELDAQGRVATVLAIVHDITERKQMETEKLLREVRQRETLVREVHHRIKNHLQGIAGLLRHKVKGNPALMPIVDSAVAELHSVAAVFGLQVDVISGHAGLKAMLDAIIASVRGVTGGHIAVQYDIARIDHVYIAENEKVPLALVLNELIFNALKHGAGRGGRKNARILISRSGDSLRIAVINKGGLPPGFSFARGRGTGSGLDLARSLLPPKISALSLHESDGMVNAVLTLVPPSITMEAVARVALPRREFDTVLM